jgi:hypothetical protein
MKKETAELVSEIIKADEENRIEAVEVWKPGRTIFNTDLGYPTHQVYEGYMSITITIRTM